MALSKSKNIKISDIKADIRSYEDLFKNNYIKKRDNDSWDWSAIENYYFKKLPKELKIDDSNIDTLEDGERLLYARDFYNGKKKKIYYFVKSISPSELGRDLKPILITKDEEGVQKVNFFDCFCKMIIKQKPTKLERLSKEYKDKKKSIKQEKKKAILENDKKKNVPIKLQKPPRNLRKIKRKK